MTIKPRAPIIEDLHFSKEEIAEVKRIQTEEPWTKRKERLRSVVGGPMCSICSSTPSKRIYYNLYGVTRIEAYCDLLLLNLKQIFLMSVIRSKEQMKNYHFSNKGPMKSKFGIDSLI